MNKIIGIHAVQSALEQNHVQLIWYDQTRHDQRLKAVLKQAQTKRVPLKPLHPRQLDKKNPTASPHQGVIALIRTQLVLSESDLDDFLIQLDHPPILLILDQVQDPHNLGACFRIAEAAGVDALISSKDRSARLGPTVSKVASGAAERLPFFQVTNLARSLRHLKHYSIQLIGTSDRAEQSIYQTQLKPPLALIMGNEQKGIRRLVLKQCDQCVRIPMQGQIESLNIATASAVILFEIMRQNHG